MITDTLTRAQQLPGIPPLFWLGLAVVGALCVWLACAWAAAAAAARNDELYARPMLSPDGRLRRPAARTASHPEQYVTPGIRALYGWEMAERQTRRSGANSEDAARRQRGCGPRLRATNVILFTPRSNVL